MAGSCGSPRFFWDQDAVTERSVATLQYHLPSLVTGLLPAHYGQ